MIFFDITKSGEAGHRSGLTRVNERLRVALGERAAPAQWAGAALRSPKGEAGPDDWFFTTELFSESERPGFTEWIARRRFRAAAVFHDAIPLQHPHITWPRSVERHPGYMKSLSRFDRVFAVSATSREDLSGFWRWQGIANPPPIDVLSLGADFDGCPRSVRSAESPRVRGSEDLTLGRSDPRILRPSVLCVGIVEPRKNQAFLVDVCQSLWRDGLEFDLHIVGRTNPHFGREIAGEIKRVQKKFRELRFHGAASDAKLAELYGTARATVMPTIAEGCGLPLLESLWRGIPCLCSDLPALQENAVGGGCVVVPVNDAEAWRRAIRDVVKGTDLQELQTAARSRPLPTWAAGAEQICAALR